MLERNMSNACEYEVVVPWTRYPRVENDTTWGKWERKVSDAYDGDVGREQLSMIEVSAEYRNVSRKITGAKEMAVGIMV